VSAAGQQVSQGASELSIDDATELGVDRLAGFADCVFAFAMTLLVLSLTVPTASVRLLPALVRQWPQLLGYLMSFAFIGGLWMAHAHLTQLMKRADTVAYGLSLLMLLFVAVLPFSTQLMVTHITGPDVEGAVLIYGINFLLASLMLSVLMIYVSEEPAMMIDNVADAALKSIYRQRWISIVVATIAVVVAIVAPLVAVALYIVETVLLLALPMLSVRRHRLRRASEG